MANGDDSAYGGGGLTTHPGEPKKWTEAIKATADAVTKTRDEHSTRSDILELNNTTSRTLGFHGSGGHDCGGFQQLPSDSIAPRQPAYSRPRVTAC
jgi:hypothetical protein